MDKSFFDEQNIDQFFAKTDIDNDKGKCKYCDYVGFPKNLIDHIKRNHAYQFCLKNDKFFECEYCK